jgi:glycosyltransferase involved in cell wall biosynthesis
MKLSVIIPCHNATRTIGATLEGLVSQIWPGDCEVIVADNSSTDDLMSVLQQYHLRLPRLRCIDASARRGPSHARNVGVRAATGEGILFCDADDVPAPGWAMAMSQGLKTHPFVACRQDFQKLNPPEVRVAREQTQVTALQRFKFLPFPHAGSGTLGIARMLHEAVGGFDESIPICEDIDYCIRVQSTGVRLEMIPDAVLHIRLRHSVSNIMVQALHYAEYEVYLFKKYGNTSMRDWWRWRQYGQRWRSLLTRMPELLRTPEGRTMFAWHLGRQVGLLKGSLRFRASPISLE